MYQVVKRDGRIVDFDISKISAAIQKAFEAVHAIDREIDALDYRDLSPEEYEEIKQSLKERRR